MTTTAVNIAGRVREYGPRLELAPPDFVYVGRRWTKGGWDLPAHALANPFTVRQYGSSEAAVAEYIRYLVASPDLFAQAVELRGSTLGCWCLPDRCHARAVAWAADGMSHEQLLIEADKLDNCARAFATSRSEL